MARSISRPSLHVLAGVNGAGKSSIMGALLKERLVYWYNPDDYSRALVAYGMTKEEADGRAWEFGVAGLSRQFSRRPTSHSKRRSGAIRSRN